MDNRVNLIDYRKSYRSKEEIRNILYSLSKDMKKHHQNGEYISDFSPRTISVCWTNSTDVLFTKYRRFGQIPLSDVIDLKINDIKKFALLSFCLFLDDYNLENGFLNMEVVKNSIEDNLNIFIESDRDYYKNVFKSDKLFYYNDYIDERVNLTKIDNIDNDSSTVNKKELGVTNYFLLCSIVAITFMITLFLILFTIF